MNFFRIPVSIIIFLLFFGVSVLEAFRTRNWMRVVFWVAIAVMFLIADNSGDREKQQNVRTERFAKRKLKRDHEK